MAIDNKNTNLINQICISSGLQGSELDALRARLSKLSETELQRELSKSLSGTKKDEMVGLEIQQTRAFPPKGGGQAYVDENGNHVTDLYDGEDLIERTITTKDDAGNTLTTTTQYANNQPEKQIKYVNGNTVSTTTFTYHDASEDNIAYVIAETKNTDNSKVITLALEVGADGSIANEDFVDRRTISMDGTETTIYPSDGNLLELQVTPTGKRTLTAYNGVDIGAYDDGNLYRLAQKVEHNGKTYYAEYDGQGNTKTVTQNGESPTLIAKRFNVKENELKRLNPLRKNPHGKGKIDPLAYVGEEILVNGQYNADSPAMRNRKSKQENLERFARQEYARRAQGLLSTEIKGQSLNKDYNGNYYSLAKDLLGSKASSAEVDAMAKDLQLLNGDNALKSGTTIRVPGKKASSQNVNILSTYGFKPSEATHGFYEKFNKLNPNEQQRVLSTIKYLKSQNITDTTQIKTEVMNTLGINLFDSEKVIHLQGTKSQTLNFNNNRFTSAISLETYVTEYLGLDLNSETGKQVYNRLNSLPQETLDTLSAKDFAYKGTYAADPKNGRPLKAFAGKSFDEVADALGALGVGIRTQEEFQTIINSPQYKREQEAIEFRKIAAQNVALVYDQAIAEIRAYQDSQGWFNVGFWREKLGNLIKNDYIDTSFEATIERLEKEKQTAVSRLNSYTGSEGGFRREFKAVTGAEYSEAKIQKFLDEASKEGNDWSAAYKDAYGSDIADWARSRVSRVATTDGICDIAAMLVGTEAIAGTSAFKGTVAGVSTQIGKVAGTKGTQILTAMTAGGLNLGSWTLLSGTVNNLTKSAPTTSEDWENLGWSTLSSVGFGAAGGLLNTTIVDKVVKNVSKVMDKPAAKALNAVEKSFEKGVSKSGTEIMTEYILGETPGFIAQSAGLLTEVAGFTVYEIAVDLCKDFITNDGFNEESMRKKLVELGKDAEEVKNLSGADLVASYLGNTAWGQVKMLGEVKGVANLMMMMRGGKTAQKLAFEENLKSCESLKDVQVRKVELNGHEVYEITYADGNRAVATSVNDLVGNFQFMMQLETISKLAKQQAEAEQQSKAETTEPPTYDPNEKAELQQLLKSQGYNREYQRNYIERILNNEEQTHIISELLKDKNIQKLKLDIEILETLDSKNLEVFKKLINYKEIMEQDESSRNHDLHTLLAPKQPEILSKLLDSGVINKTNVTNIWRILVFTSENNLDYVKDFFDNSRDLFISQMMMNPEKFGGHIAYVDQNNAALAKELLNTKTLLPEQLFAACKMTGSNLERFDMNQKIELARQLQTFTPEIKEIFAKHGFSLDNISDILSGNRSAVSIPKEQQGEFLKNVIANNNPQGTKVLSEFDFSQFGKEGVPLKYSRKDFTKNVNEIIKDLTPAEQNIILGHFGLDANFDGLINNKPFSDNTASEKVRNAAQRVLAEIENFTTKNETTIQDPEAKAILDGLIQGLPEFTSVIGKQQHGTHAYSVDVHMLKVLQSAMKDPLYDTLSDQGKTILKMSALLHDIGKATGVVDNGHFRTSSEYMYSILDKFKLSDDVKQRIIDTIDNHHWFAAYNTGKMSAENAAAHMRHPGDFAIYKLMAKADLSNVNKKFHLSRTGTKNQAEFDAYFDAKMKPIEEALRTIQETAPVLMDTKIVNGEKFPTERVEIDGEETELKVLNFANLSEGESLEQYGFAPGVTRDNATFNIHMTRDLEDTYNLLNSPRRLHQKHPALSSSMVRLNEGSSYSGYGFILDVDNANLVQASNDNFASGMKKDLSTEYSHLFSPVGRAGYRDALINEISQRSGVTLTPAEYATLFEKHLADKKYSSQIRNDIQIGDKVIKAEDLRAAIEKSTAHILEEAFANNEVVSIDPKLKGLVAKTMTGKLEDCAPEFLAFAKKHNLPIILLPEKGAEITSTNKVQSEPQDKVMTSGGTISTRDINIEQAKAENPAEVTADRIKSEIIKTESDGGIRLNTAESLDAELTDAELNPNIPIENFETLMLAYTGKLTEKLTERYEHAGKIFEEIIQNNKHEIAKLEKEYSTNQEQFAQKFTEFLADKLGLKGIEPNIRMIESESADGYFDWPTGELLLSQDLKNPKDIETIIAHEFVHVIQFKDILAAYGTDGIRELYLNHNDGKFIENRTKNILEKQGIDYEILTPEEKAEYQYTVADILTDETLEANSNLHKFAKENPLEKGSLNEYLAKIYKSENEKVTEFDTPEYYDQTIEREAYHLGNNKVGNSINETNVQAPREYAKSISDLLVDEHISNDEANAILRQFGVSEQDIASLRNEIREPFNGIVEALNILSRLHADMDLNNMSVDEIKQSVREVSKEENSLEAIKIFNEENLKILSTRFNMTENEAAKFIEKLFDNEDRKNIEQNFVTAQEISEVTGLSLVEVINSIDSYEPERMALLTPERLRAQKAIAEALDIDFKLWAAEDIKNPELITPEFLQDIKVLGEKLKHLGISREYGWHNPVEIFTDLKDILDKCENTGLDFTWYKGELPQSSLKNLMAQQNDLTKVKAFIDACSPECKKKFYRDVIEYASSKEKLTDIEGYTDILNAMAGLKTDIKSHWDKLREPYHFIPELEKIGATDFKGIAKLLRAFDEAGTFPSWNHFVYDFKIENGNYDDAAKFVTKLKELFGDKKNVYHYGYSAIDSYISYHWKTNTNFKQAIDRIDEVIKGGLSQNTHVLQNIDSLITSKNPQAVEIFKQLHKYGFTYDSLVRDLLDDNKYNVDNIQKVIDVFLEEIVKQNPLLDFPPEDILELTNHYNNNHSNMYLLKHMIDQECFDFKDATEKIRWSYNFNLHITPENKEFITRLLTDKELDFPKDVTCSLGRIVNSENIALATKLCTDKELKFPTANIDNILRNTNNANIDLMTRLCTDKELDFPIDHLSNIAYCAKRDNITLVTRLCTDKELNFPIDMIPIIAYNTKESNIDLVTYLCTDKELNFPIDKIVYLTSGLKLEDLDPKYIGQKMKDFMDSGLDDGLIKDICNNAKSLSLFNDDVIGILKRLKDDNVYIGDLVSILTSGSTPFELPDKIDSLVMLSKLSAEDKAVLKKQGFDLDNIINRLMLEIDRKYPTISTSKEDARNFLKHIGNNRGADAVIQGADFAQFGRKGIPLEYSREEFMANMDRIVRESAENISDIDISSVQIPKLQLTEADYQATQEKIEELKQAHQTEEVEVILDGKRVNGTRFLGTQGGSNTAYYTQIGKKLYYIKYPEASKLGQSVEEVLASRLYRAAGIDSPNMEYVYDSEGQIIGMAGEYVPSMSKKPFSQEQFTDGFAVDAWLANWDAPKNDNTQFRENGVIKVDVGGSLRYRARGEMKEFNSVVNELTTLIEQNLKFTQMTKEELLSSLKHVTEMPEEQIHKIIQDSPLDDISLINTLLRRKEYMTIFAEKLESLDSKDFKDILQMVNKARELTLKEFSDVDNVAKMLGYVRTKTGFEGLLNTQNLDNLGLTPEQRETANKMLVEIEKFTKGNKIADGVNLPQEVKDFLNSILQGVPEFAAFFSKPQHSTQEYSLDVHILKVLQDSLNDPMYKQLGDTDKIVLKFATLLHDIGKRYLTEGSDTGHAEKSAEYVYSILDRFNLTPEIKDRIISIVDNHHWFKAYNTGAMSAQDVATLCRRPEDFLIYQIMAKADLKNVNENFYQKVLGVSSQAEADIAFANKIDRIRPYVNQLAEKQVVITTSKFTQVPERTTSSGRVLPAREFPKETTNLNGVDTEFSVLNLTTMDENTDMFQFGFNKIPMKDLRLFVHMIQQKVNLDVFKTLAQNPMNNSAQSISMISMADKSTYAGLSFGLVLDVENANISHAYYANTGSGTKKGFKSFVHEMFETGSHRSFVKDSFKSYMSERGIELTDSEYATIAKYIMGKQYPETQIRGIKIGDRSISREDILGAFTFSRDQLIEQKKQKTHGTHNEIVGLNSKIKGVVAKVNSLEKCPYWLLQFAKDNNYPIILVGN